MNRVSQRQLIAVAVLVAAAIFVVIVLGAEQKTILAVGVYALLAGSLLVSAGGDSGSTELVETIASSVRRMVDGRKPEPPRDASPAVQRLYEELAEAHQAIKEI